MEVHIVEQACRALLGCVLHASASVPPGPRTVDDCSHTPEGAARAPRLLWMEEAVHVPWNPVLRWMNQVCVNLDTMAATAAFHRDRKNTIRIAVSSLGAHTAAECP